MRSIGLVFVEIWTKYYRNFVKTAIFAHFDQTSSFFENEETVPILYVFELAFVQQHTA